MAEPAPVGRCGDELRVVRYGGREVTWKVLDFAIVSSPGFEGFDPNKEEIPDDASLRIRLIYCLTSIDHTLKTTAGEFLLAVCDGDSQEFVRLCGLGSAAGLVQQKDMMSMFSNLATGGGA